MIEGLTINLNQIPNFYNLLYDTKNETNETNETKEINETKETKETNETKENILKLIKIECNTENNTKYKIIKYDKNLLNFDLINSYGLCRSIVINSENKVVCVSPPKSISSDTFIQKYPDLNDDIVIQEFIEGTMINVFYDNSIGVNGAWEISTKSVVGANTSFYKSKNSKSFREMFLEAVKECNLSLDSLNKFLCYSFVLQHPNNRIVVPFVKPKLYLVAVYYIKNLGKTNIEVSSYSVNSIRHLDWGNTTIQFPEIYDKTSYTELIQKYASMNTNYHILGFMMYNLKTGERAKVRNPVYEQIRQLKGNQPKLQYQYLCLRKQGKVGEYLKFFPESKVEFSNFRDDIHLFTGY
jgi:hypothetical protein